MERRDVRHASRVVHRCCYGMRGAHPCPERAIWQIQRVPGLYWCPAHKHRGDVPLGQATWEGADAPAPTQSRQEVWDDEAGERAARRARPRRPRRPRRGEA